MPVINKRSAKQVKAMTNCVIINAVLLLSEVKVLFLLLSFDLAARQPTDRHTNNGSILYTLCRIIRHLQDYIEYTLYIIKIN